jgi:hypothetical protein
MQGEPATAVVPGDSVAMQLIAPQQVTTQGLYGNNEVLALFPTLTLVIPEPGVPRLIGCGVAGLGVPGRSRMKRWGKLPGSQEAASR